MAPLVDGEGEALRLRALTTCLRDTGAAVSHYAADSERDYAENLPEGWPAGDPPEFRDALGRVLESGDPETIAIDFGRSSFEITLSVDEDGGAFAVTTDVTKTREHERAIHNLLREVSHRSKNLLAIVQAVSAQTARHSGGIDDFVEKFQGRLQALSSTQDLVTASDWRGARFRALASAQLATLGSPIELSGEDPLLKPNAALHVGLALHELAANAVAHDGGALGPVAIDAQVGGLPGHRILTLTWAETLPENLTPADPRFGTMVLEKIVPLSVGGSAHYQVEPGLVRYRLTMPSSQFET